jgi:serine/threonine-protein kinase HipA
MHGVRKRRRSDHDIRDGVVRLSPAYDLLKSTPVLGNASEECALPLRGRKRKLTRNDWVDHFCRERPGLLPAIIDPILHTLDTARNAWARKIENSYLSAAAKAGYLDILAERRSCLLG